jgi:hypothetical protein
MLPAKQPDNIIKTTLIISQAPKMLVPRVEEISNNNKSEKNF